MSMRRHPDWTRLRAEEALPAGVAAPLAAQWELVVSRPAGELLEPEVPRQAEEPRESAQAAAAVLAAAKQVAE